MDEQTQAPVSPVAAAVAAVEAKNGTAPQTETQPDARLELFARKEAALVKEKQAWEQEKLTWQEKLAKYETEYIPRNRIKEDPLAVLEEAGYTYEQLTEMLVNQPNITDPTIRALKAEINKLKQGQTEVEKKAQEQEQARYQQALKQISNEVKMLVDSSPEYETIKETGMQEAVTQLIEDTFNKEGILLDIDDAAKRVEEHLLAEAEKMAGLRKLKERMGAKQTPAEAPVSPPSNAQKPLTITNAVTAPSKPSSEKDRIARAMAAFQGKLQQ